MPIEFYGFVDSFSALTMSVGWHGRKDIRSVRNLASAVPKNCLWNTCGTPG